MCIILHQPQPQPPHTHTPEPPTELHVRVLLLGTFLTASLQPAKTSSENGKFLILEMLHPWVRLRLNSLFCHLSYLQKL